MTDNLKKRAPPGRSKIKKRACSLVARTGFFDRRIFKCSGLTRALM
jgi:hypothetical protein